MIYKDCDILEHRFPSIFFLNSMAAEFRNGAGLPQASHRPSALMRTLAHPRLADETWCGYLNLMYIIIP